MDANVGEIRLFAFAWAPIGWTRCDGTLLEIERYAALHGVLGTHYGGDGRSTFAVPDLRGRTPVHIGTATDGTNVSHGEAGGQYEVILTLDELPPHTHSVQTHSEAQQSASGKQLGSAGTWQIQTAGAQHRTFAVNARNDAQEGAQEDARGEAGGHGSPAAAPWAAESVSLSGQGAAHSNMQPSLVINFCIALEPIATTVPQFDSSPQTASEPQPASRNRKAKQSSGAQTNDAFSHYMGEIRLFASDALPNGWLPCDGRQLQVAEHNTLYSLIGNWFGGDGIHEFALPDLRGRVPVHDGKGPKGMPALRAGTRLGTETVALTSDQMPAHRHDLFAGRMTMATADATDYSGDKGDMAPLSEPQASGRRSGADPDRRQDQQDQQDQQEMLPLSQPGNNEPLQEVSMLHGETLGQSGLSEVHDNMMPSFALQYAIAVEGEYPPEP